MDTYVCTYMYTYTLNTYSKNHFIGPSFTIINYYSFPKILKSTLASVEFLGNQPRQTEISIQPKNSRLLRGAEITQFVLREESEKLTISNKKFHQINTVLH